MAVMQRDLVLLGARVERAGHRRKRAVVPGLRRLARHPAAGGHARLPVRLRESGVRGAGQRETARSREA
jgi:hypothetical protein